MRVKPTADAGERGTDREGRDLKRPHVEAHQIGHALVIVDCGNRDAKARGKQ